MHGKDKQGQGQGRGGNDDRGRNDERGRNEDRGRPETGRPANPGRSESSPGHMKRAADARSARDYAPGRTGRAVGIEEAAPDEIGERR